MDTFSFSSEKLRDIQSLILHFDRVKVQLMDNKQLNLIPFHDTYFLITKSVFSKLGTGFFENDITIGNITINSNGKADAYIAKILDLDTINFCNEYYADTIPVDTIVPIDTTEDTTINYVNNIRPDLKIQVFPNPTKDKLIISVDKDCSATMYDVAGSLVIATKEKEIDMSSLRNGMYILHIKIDDIIINYKIIKI